MSTIRAQLTTAYATALIGTVGVFAGVIWTTRREGMVDAQRQHALIEANLALRLIRQSELAGQPVTANRDSLVGAQLDAPLRTMLEGMPDYLLVLDASGRILYVSAPIRDLNEDPDQLAALMAAAVSAPTTGVAKTVSLDDRDHEQLAIIERDRLCDAGGRRADGRSGERADHRRRQDGLAR